ncbi:MAG: hypothetical protein AAF731_07715 [Bacteroidota bacterium]
MNIEKAVNVIDQFVEKTEVLIGLEMKVALKKVANVYSSLSKGQMEHLQGHWYSKDGDIGSFYLNLDRGNKRLFLEYHGISVESEKYPGEKEYFEAQMDNRLSRWDIHAFELEVVHQFFLMGNNNSLEIVNEVEGAKVLFDHLEIVGVDKYGNGVNWCKYYAHLYEFDIPERRGIVEFACSV